MFLLFMVSDPVLLNQSVQWVIACAIGIGAPLLVRDVDREARTLTRFIPPLVVVASAYTLVEFALTSNVIFDAIYASNGVPTVQRWSTYRVHGFFGHPLYAGTFFSAAFAYTFARWLAKAGSLTVAALAGAAVVVTVSRGALIAAGVGVAVALLLATPLREASRLRKLTSVGLIAVATSAVVSVGLLQARVGTTEAATSNDARFSVIGVAVGAADSTGWLGGGPGLARYTAEPFNPARLLIESSLLQLLISVGMVGLLTYVALMIVRMVDAARMRNAAAAAAIAALTTSLIGYDGLESLPTLQILVCTLFLLSRQNPAPLARALEVRHTRPRIDFAR
ncbi:O-antigen ligase family protein [Microbacterium yannicii]|uniref:O-antigen ligase family protein n=1 Tax=Microbacterium yannicii TaxID=671622 RepID=UPI00178C2020|nr:O-antigen ligase family protein [Microbacterium yannicii]